LELRPYGKYATNLVAKTKRPMRKSLKSLIKGDDNQRSLVLEECNLKAFNRDVLQFIGE
jgi:hypothetical protein